jgi:hypothetical protein
MNIIGDHLAAWLGTVLIGVLTVFSDTIVGRIRFRLNRADLRTKYFERLAKDLSAYLFYAEIFEERYRRKWIDADDLGALGSDINGAITTLRKKEAVYRSWAKKYWGAKSAYQLADVMAAVKSVDDAVHAFNDEGGEEQKTEVLGRRLSDARMKVDDWLSKTDA